jgi:cholesterol oxidase
VDGQPEHFDVAVVGSGFGGSVAALRLTEKGYRVAVFESGRRWSPDDFPGTNWNLPRFLWLPGLGMRGIQRIRMLRNVLVLSGAGVGGGSLNYAGVLFEPLDAFWRDPGWPPVTDWKSELAPFYERARRMLGAARASADTPADAVMRELAARLDASPSHQPTDVGIYFGQEGRSVADPYFGGAGPARSGCRLCGGCMVGCRDGAKNSLDLNYLWLAESNGAQIYPETKVVELVPLASGYRIVTERPGSWLRRRRRTFHADQVVISAGVLGTLDLLLRHRASGQLPRLSPRLGRRVRTNSEALVGGVARDRRTDYSAGVAITSSIRLDAQTQIEPCRYPRGSNAMGLLGTVLVDGDGSLPRPIRFVREMGLRPLSFVRSLSVYHWSERAVILLVMQSADSSMRVELRRGMFGSRLTSASEDRPMPTYLPIANRAARIAAEIMHGRPMGTITDALLGVPMTAHILGGACIGSSPETGVIDPYHRMFGYPTLHVVDGSAIGANLGANPSLTITAMAERAMSYWPNKDEQDPRPPLGRYRALRPIAPRNPAVRAERVRSVREDADGG